MDYKVIEGKVYKEVAVSDLDQLKNKVEQVYQTVLPKMRRVEQLKIELKTEEAQIAQFLKALERDIELVKVVCPDRAKELGFLEH